MVGLYRLGQPTPGRITARRPEKGMDGERLLDYEFTPEDGRPATGTMWVVESEWNRAAVGDEVTVLHYPGRATPSVVCEHGDYVNVEGAAAASQ